MLSTCRSGQPPLKRSKSLHLVRRDGTQATFSSLPQNLMLEPGRMELRCKNGEELAQTLILVAQLLEDEGDRLRDLCPAPVPSSSGNSL